VFSFDGNTYLETMATSTNGDRTTLGYTIGKGTMLSVNFRIAGQQCLLARDRVGGG
jgi:hypothetical protein